MRLLPKLSALQRRSEVSKRRLETTLALSAREDADLCRSEEAISAQAEGVRQLLGTLRLEGAVMNREQLYEQLRKQAVLQYRLQNLALQSSQLNEKRQELALRRNVWKQEFMVWQRKDERYLRWVSRVCHQERMQCLRHDEAEQEEMATWKKI